MQHDPPIGSIVVAVDADAPVDSVLVAAADLAASTHRPLHVVNATGVGIVPWSTLMLERQEAKLEHLRGRLAALSGVGVTSQTVLEQPAAAIVRASDAAEVVVMGSGRLGRLAAEALGATTHQVVSHAHCPVLVVPDELSLPAQGSVVVGVDAEEHCAPAVEVAFAEASRRGVPLVAVHAWWMEHVDPLADPREWVAGEHPAVETERLAISEMLAGWSEKYPDVELSTWIRRGEPVPVLRGAARSAQLLVLGTRGRGGFAGLLLGGVSSRLLHDSPCPVLVVPSRPRLVHADAWSGDPL